jgi:hypothetical protein
MLVPGDPGSIGLHVYVFTVESQQPVGARHTSCTQLLWKPHGPSRQDTPIYLSEIWKRKLLEIITHASGYKSDWDGALLHAVGRESATSSIINFTKYKRLNGYGS